MMDADRQHMRLAIAAILMAAMRARDGASDSDGIARTALADADALLRALPL